MQMQQGKRYLIITTFGWGFVGVVERHVGVNEVELSGCHFITRCGTETDWGRFARHGPGPNAIVNLIGTVVLNLDHRIWSMEYNHQLPESR